MPSLGNYKKEQMGRLLGHDLMDATLTNARINLLQPDDNLRTIVIGIGGTGVKTIDYVKGAISKRLSPTWKDYVAFLGIDASWTELDNAHYLDKGNEGLCTTLTGSTSRMQTISTYPRAVRPFMIDNSQDPSRAVQLGNLENDGAQMTRLIGKIKLHDQSPGSPGVDEQIVQKLQSIITKLAPLPPAYAGTAAMFYDVYVIGSGSGGTGSGSFLEMPALIRKALQGAPAHINGILYLPDTLTGLNPNAKGQLMANGYATLKEMNYFQGLYMRDGYQEIWSYSNPASPELKMDSRDGYYDIPYLIGSPGAAATNASEVSRETIAEFLVSMLVKATPIPGVYPFLTSAFQSNATAANATNDKDSNPGNPNDEASGTAHEFPKCFASIGYAEATAPRKLVRAYAVKEVIENAGLKPVSPEEYAKRKAEGASLLPFQSPSSMLNATMGTAQAEKLLEPIARIHAMINNGAFNFISDLHLSPDAVNWESVKVKTYSTKAIEEQINNIVRDRTNVAATEILRNYIRDQYRTYRNNVREYVKQEGPYAFANLYAGNFVKVGDDEGMGIRTMLRNLAEGRQMKGQPIHPRSVQDARAILAECERNIDTTTKFIDLKGTKKRQFADWLNAYNVWVAARINEKRREVAFGKSGILMSEFATPAEVLATQVLTFGDALVALCDIYTHIGENMDSFEKFSGAADSQTGVNIASLNDTSYNWLKKQADECIQNVRAGQFRNDLVDAFFEQPERWLDVNEHLVTTPAGGEVRLVTPDKPVAARELFDDFVTERIVLQVNASILDLFEELNNQGTSFQSTAQQILSKLIAKSQPRFNGQLHDRHVHRYIKYPNVLNTVGGNGPAIAQAITNAASIYGIPATSVYPSDDTDSILLYQQATALEVYRINGIAEWEAEYEAKLDIQPMLMHGKSPDTVKVTTDDGTLTYHEVQPWKDYPSIVQRDKPETPDPVTGRICREGEARLRLQALVEKAKTLGVLFSQQTPGGWIINRVNCDMTVDWTFDVTRCTPDPVTELLPQGKKLAEELAVQNGKTFASMVKPVMLRLAGLFSQPASSEEYAWRNATRVLRAHHPMLCEVKNTCEKFETWDSVVNDFNQVVLSRRRPAMMIYLLKGGVVVRRSDGAWEWKKGDGTSQMIANYTPAMLTFTNPIEKFQIENGLLAYNVYKRLDSMMPGNQLKEEYLRAKNKYDLWVNTMDMPNLQAGQALVDLVEKERQDLLAKGAGNGSGPISVLFRESMAYMNLSESQLQQIEEFYTRTTLWSML